MTAKYTTSKLCWLKSAILCLDPSVVPPSGWRKVWQQEWFLSLYFFYSSIFQPTICLRKMLTSVKSFVCRKRWGMRGLQHKMLGLIDQLSLALSKLASQEKHDSLSLIWECLYGRICKLFSSYTAMRSRISGSDSQHRVEQQYSLLRPSAEIARKRYGCSYITLHLFEYVFQRWRELGDLVWHTKREPMCLTWTVIGILPQYHYLYLIKWCQIVRSKYLLWCRIQNFSSGFFVDQWFFDLRKIWLGKLLS